MHLAKMLAAEEMVLLRNELDGDRRILPLRPDDTLHLDLSECGQDKMYLSGGGSGIVGEQTYTHVPDGVRAAVAQGAWKSGSGKYKLTCRNSYSAENQDRSKEEVNNKYRKNGIDAKTILFLSTPGQVPVAELTSAGAIIYSLFPGQRAGHALADLLAGVYQPTGHLAYTLHDTQAGFLRVE